MYVFGFSALPPDLDPAMRALILQRIEDLGSDADLATADALAAPFFLGRLAWCKGPELAIEAAIRQAIADHNLPERTPNE